MAYPSIPSPDELPIYPATVEHGSLITSEKTVFYSKKGSASKEEGLEAITIPQLLQRAASQCPDKPALQVERPLKDVSELTKVDGKLQAPSEPLVTWKTWTFQEYYQDCRKFAKSLLHLDFQPHSSVGIYGFNSPEWTISMMGGIFAGGNPAGIYPSDTGAQITFKSDHSNGHVLVVDTEKTLEKVKAVVKDLPLLKALICWGDFTKEEIKNQKGEKVEMYSWEEFMKLGENVTEDVLNKRIEDQKPSQCATLVYTSGTTGNPKAVMLSHDAVIFTAYALCMEGLGDIGQKPMQERVASYLPLCHVAGMMVDLIAPLIITAFLPGWCTLGFARPYDLKMGSLVERLQAIQPTLFLGVPRVWEKMSEKLQSALGAATGFKATLANWAMKQGQQYTSSLNFNHQNPKFGSIPSKGIFYHIADRLVLSKVRQKLGLDCARFCLSGAAPIQIETQKYMANFGIFINEAYGMSEGSAGTTWSRHDLHLWGSSGISFPKEEVKCFTVDENDINKKTETPPAEDLFHPTEAEQGELCYRGRNVMIGYLANPRLGKEHMKEIQDKTKAAIDAEGFIHSGDKCCRSKYGFFRITGRYKEIIIGAGGENIAPVPIEDEVKRLCSIVSNIVMIGDKKKFNIALVCLKLEGATGELPGSENLLEGAFDHLKTESKTIDEAMKDEKVVGFIKEKLEAVNKDGKVCVSNASTIQKFMILPRDLSVAMGDFTPTLKLKRGFVAEKFAGVIDEVYASKEVYVPFPMEKFQTYFS